MSLARLALVTGATSGLGEALAWKLAQQDISLLLTGRNAKKLEALASKLSVPCTVLAADLTLPNERHKLISLIHTHQPDLVINNAGAGLYGDALTHPTADLLNMIELNVKALVDISLESAHTLLQAGKKGTILNVSSAASFFLYPSFAVYAASKTFVNSFSQALDLELMPHGIRVLTVCPGQINTDFQRRASQGFFQKKTLWSMSPEKAAQLILDQIEKQKPLLVIGRRYQVLLFLSRLAPKFWVTKLLRAKIKIRVKNHPRYF